MTKSELIDAVAQRTKITKSRAEQVVNCVFDSMTQAMERSEGIAPVIALTAPVATAAEPIMDSTEVVGPRQVEAPVIGMALDGREVGIQLLRLF